MNEFLHLTEFIHQSLVHVQTTRRIEYHQIMAILAGIVQSLSCSFHSRHIRSEGEYIHSDLLSEGLQLVYRSRTNHIRCHQQDFFLQFLLCIAGDFAGCRCLSCTLQTGHHHRSQSVRIQGKFCITASKQFLEFIPDNLHHHLRGVEGFHDFLTERLFLDPGHKVLHNSVIDICFQKAHAYFLEHIVHVFFRQFSLPGDVFHRLGKTFA